MITEQAPDIGELDALDRAERAILLCRECQFADLLGKVQRDLAASAMPIVLLALALSDGEQRKEVALRYRRLVAMLGPPASGALGVPEALAGAR